MDQVVLNSCGAIAPSLMVSYLTSFVKSRLFHIGGDSIAVSISVVILVDFDEQTLPYWCTLHAPQCSATKCKWDSYVNVDLFFQSTLQIHPEMRFY